MFFHFVSRGDFRVFCICRERTLRSTALYSVHYLLKIIYSSTPGWIYLPQNITFDLI